METYSKISELLRKFSHASGILVYFGYLGHTQILLRSLCKDTNELWEIYQKSFEFGFRKQRRILKYCRPFDDAFAEQYFTDENISKSYSFDLELNLNKLDLLVNSLAHHPCSNQVKLTKLLLMFAFSVEKYQQLCDIGAAYNLDITKIRFYAPISQGVPSNAELGQFEYFHELKGYSISPLFKHVDTFHLDQRSLSQGITEELNASVRHLNISIDHEFDITELYWKPNLLESVSEITLKITEITRNYLSGSTSIKGIFNILKTLKWIHDNFANINKVSLRSSTNLFGFGARNIFPNVEDDLSHIFSGVEQFDTPFNLEFGYANHLFQYDLKGRSKVYVVELFYTEFKSVEDKPQQKLRVFECDEITLLLGSYTKAFIHLDDKYIGIHDLNGVSLHQMRSLSVASLQESEISYIHGLISQFVEQDTLNANSGTLKPNKQFIILKAPGLEYEKFTQILPGFQNGYFSFSQRCSTWSGNGRSKLKAVLPPMSANQSFQSNNMLKVIQNHFGNIDELDICIELHSMI